MTYLVLCVSQIGRTKFGLLVCDEAHKLKNPKTAVYTALHSLDSRMRIMVTGTPIQNGSMQTPVLRASTFPYPFNGPCPLLYALCFAAHT